MIKFLLDMGVSPLCKNWIDNQGYNSVHLSELSLHQLYDSQIIELAQKEKRVILTCDTDFGTLLALGNYTYPSVILFRLSNYKPENICNKLSVILKEISQEEFGNGLLVTVKDKNYRIRKLPII